MNEKEGAITVCKKCGRAFDENEKDADPERLYCSQCMIELAEEYVPEQVEASNLGHIRKAKVWRPLLWVVLVVCLSVIVIRVPGLISCFKEDKPLRNGTYVTDAKTDQCIKDLWHIASLLQEDKRPGDDILCPVSNEPYVVTKEDGDVVVRTPHPEVYGFKEIRASRERPVPELIK